ncbi:hypothetical protein OIU76_028836 [Salix suchowensis]|nr:hypothetical protein OIU76_028836 [Salix suchowensis]
MGVLGIAFFASNEPIFNFETSVNQSYPMTLEILFYIGFLIAFVVKSPIIPLWMDSNKYVVIIPRPFYIFFLVDSSRHNTNNLATSTSSSEKHLKKKK